MRDCFPSSEVEDQQALCATESFLPTFSDGELSSLLLCMVSGRSGEITRPTAKVSARPRNPGLLLSPSFLEEVQTILLDQARLPISSLLRPVSGGGSFFSFLFPNVALCSSRPRLARESRSRQGSPPRAVFFA